jgi:hypothetical protein
MLGGFRRYQWIIPLDAEYVLESADSLSVFGAEDPDWPAAGGVECRAARELANALDLFPSEAEEVAADESVWSCGGAAISPDLLAEFDSDSDDAIGAIERVVPSRAAVRMPWAPARVAVIIALAVFMPSTRAAKSRSSDRPIAPARSATITRTDARSEEPHAAPIDRPAPAVVTSVANAQPEIPATMATAGRSASRSREDTTSTQPNPVPLKAADSEPSITIAPTAVSAPYAAPIDSPPPLPRTPPLAPAEVAPTVTVAPPPATVPSETSVVRSDTDDVRAVLDRYQTAFRDLDASKAKAIWPSVDEKALRRAFGQLERQEVILEGCDVMVAGQRAAAECRGRSSYIPRVGNKAARVEARRWAFTLRKIGESWIIEAVDLASR